MTVTVSDCDGVDVLPDPSVAEHDTLVAPMGNVDPLAGAQSMVGVAVTSSVAVAANVTTAPAEVLASAVTATVQHRHIRVRPGSARLP